MLSAVISSPTLVSDMKVVLPKSPRKSYSELLRDPRWQKKRLQILERDGWKCLDCGDESKTLNVHHHTYRNGAAPWDYKDSNFGTFCEDCHKRRHGELKLLKVAMDCFTRNLTASQIRNLHRAFMFKGGALDVINSLVKGANEGQ